MPRGDKSKYTDKQERKADHIAESYESRGVPEQEAERRAWATVNKGDGGGKMGGGSGRGKVTGHTAAHKGSRMGGAASAARSAASRSAAARKAAVTRKRNAQSTDPCGRPLFRCRARRLCRRAEAEAVNMVVHVEWPTIL
jgi:plasmid stabilization system protein ParE